MEEKVNILGIEVNNYSSLNAMEKVEGYFDNDIMNVINTIYSDVLVTAEKDTLLKSEIQKADLTIIGDKAILSAASITDELREQEVANSIFLTRFLQYISEENKKLILLAEKEEINLEIREYLSKYYEDLTAAEMLTVSEDREDDDKIVNEINGVDADVLISTLSSPMQEMFIANNKSKLNVKVWFGIGESNYIMNAKTGLLKRLIEMGNFKRQVSKLKNKDENEE